MRLRGARHSLFKKRKIMLKLVRERVNCDLKRIARIQNEILFVELFGRNQIIKALSASILEKRSDFVLSGSRLDYIFVDKSARYKRKIVPLSDGYAHCIVYQDELFSEKYLIAKDMDDRKRAFQIWLSKIALPIPYKSNLVFIDMLYKEISSALDWIYMETENNKEENEEIPHLNQWNFTKKESLSFCNMDFLIQHEYKELVEAVESVFIDFKLNKKVA